ncbi:polysaccharide deacetylase family protein [Streptomyces sp. NPDC005548]|uniref:polysaccharide deacetylase family protein n=1 Tax=Streptomyces sp. NPDC005548 TaxID=3364724 RepID=UPI00369AB3DF
MNPAVHPNEPVQAEGTPTDPAASGSSGNRSVGAVVRLRLLRTGLGLLSAVVVATPFTAAWQFDAHRDTVAGQAPAPASAPDAATLSGARSPQAPIVLAYHDIGPAGASPYTVRPQRFAEQLAALRSAGYRTLSTDEFTAYLRTGRAPAPRTVYLTFDDGAHGLWVHADPILAKYRMRAAGFVITGSVGTHRPYYLSWPEIRRMARSGRWDFQDHTHLAHRRAAVDASGRLASVLNNRLWLGSAERLETRSEYERRVRTDLDRSLSAFGEQGLPRPALFAYPFSEATQAGNLGAGGSFVLARLLRARFTATLTNASPRPLPAGPRAAAAGRVQRLEVTRDTTAGSLLREMSSWSSVGPAGVRRPLTHPVSWARAGGSCGTGIATLTGGDACPDREGYVVSAFRPVATADWTSYRLRFRVGRLGGTSNNTSVTVRYGSAHPTVLSVGHHTATLGERGARDRRAVHLRAPAATHTVELTVTPDMVRAEIDGRQSVSLPAGRSPEADRSGGFALGARRAGTAPDWPRYTMLEVGPASG